VISSLVAITIVVTLAVSYQMLMLPG